MSIQVTCGGCGKSLTASVKLAGKTVPCPSCKRPLVLPRAEQVPAPTAAAQAASPSAGGKSVPRSEPSLDSPIDYNLMIEASTPEKVAQPQAKRAEGVDWDAIAGKKPADAAARPITSDQEPIVQHYNPNDPTVAGSSAQSMPAFLRSGAMAIVSCVHHLPLIFIVGLVYVAAICALAATLVGMIDVFSANSATPKAPVIGLVLLFVAWLLIHLCYLGYVGGYLGEITLAAKEDRQFTSPPEFNIGRLTMNALQYFVLTLVYVVPLVTLPLAPMAFLTWAMHRDGRAFDIAWVTRATLRHPLHVLVALGLGGVFYALSIMLFGLLAEPVDQLVDILDSKSAIAMQPGVLEFARNNLFFLVASPVMFLMSAATCHVVGLIGRFNPDVCLFMPKKVRPTALLSLGALPMGFMAVIHLWPAILAWQAETFGRPCVVVVDDADTDGGTTSPGGTSPTSGEPDFSVPPGTRPTSPTSFVTVREALGSDFAQLNPAEQARRIAGRLNFQEYLRVELLARLAQIAPEDASRDVVTKALEQTIALERRTDVIQQAALVHAQWGGDADKLLAAQLACPDDNTRKASVFQLTGVEVNPERAKVLVPALRRAAIMRSYEASVQHEAAALLATWSTQASDAALSLQVFSQDGAERHVALREAVQKLGTEQATLAIVEKAAKSSSNQTAWSMVESLGPAAEPALLSVMSRSNDPAQQRAARLLVTIGTKKAVPTLRRAAISRDISVRAASREALKRIEGDDFDAVAEALLDLSPELANDFTARGNAVKLLEKAPIDPARRKDVTDGLATLVESSSVVGESAARVAGRWGGNEQLPKFAKWIESSRDSLSRCGVAAAGGVGTTEAAALLVPYLTDLQLSYYARQALIECGPKAEAPVLKTLQTSRDASLRLACVRLLEKVGTRACLATLIPLAKSRVDFSLASAAAQAVLAIQKREQGK